MHPKKRTTTIGGGLSGGVLCQKVHSRLGASAISQKSKKGEMKPRNRIYSKYVAPLGPPGGPQGALGDPQGGPREPKMDPKEFQRQPSGTPSCEAATLQYRCFYYMKWYILASGGGPGQAQSRQRGAENTTWNPTIAQKREKEVKKEQV